MFEVCERHVGDGRLHPRHEHEIGTILGFNIIGQSSIHTNTTSIQLLASHLIPCCLQAFH